MCAACQTGYQETRNLFNHANMRVEITKTISNFFIAYIRFDSISASPFVRFHALLGYPPPPILECAYFLNDPLLELAEKEIERLLKSNKKSETEKHLQHVELKLEKLQEFKYAAQEKPRRMDNLEEWSSVMEEKMACFDDAVDRLKSAISNVEKKEEAKEKHEGNIIQEKIFKRRK